MPCLSHQFPEVLVVVLVGFVVVADVVTDVVEDVTGCEVGVVVVVVDVAVPQEARSIAATTAKLRANHKTFFFNLSSILNCRREFISE